METLAYLALEANTCADEIVARYISKHPYIIQKTLDLITNSMDKALLNRALQKEWDTDAHISLVYSLNYIIVTEFQETETISVFPPVLMYKLLTKTIRINLHEKYFDIRIDSLLVLEHKFSSEYYFQNIRLKSFKDFNLYIVPYLQEVWPIIKNFIYKEIINK